MQSNSDKILLDKILLDKILSVIQNLKEINKNAKLKEEHQLFEKTTIQ